MSVIALITQRSDATLVVPWAASFAKARETTLTLLCWSSSASDPESLEQSGEDQIDIDLLY